MKLFRIIASSKLWLALTVLWMIGLFIASSRQGNPNSPQIFPHFDKVLHFSFFMGGSMILTSFIYWQKKGLPLSIKNYCFIILFFALAGVIDEYHQSSVPYRSGNDVYDWLADFAGAITGFVCSIPILNFIRSRFSKKIST